MTLDDLLRTLAESSEADWHHITCWGANFGPSYHDKFVLHGSYQGQNSVITVESHGNIAVFKPNISISLAWGITAQERFTPEWTKNLPNPQVTKHYADVFFNGLLVYREEYVSVDGAAYLPMPNGFDGLKIELAHYQLIKLIDMLDSKGKFDAYFERVGMQVKL